MLTDPQPSWAVATPVLLVLVSAGHSRTWLAGQVMMGGVVSWTVIVWTTLVVLPALSVAIQIRETILEAPQPLLTMSV